MNRLIKVLFLAGMQQWLPSRSFSASVLVFPFVLNTAVRVDTLKHISDRVIATSRIFSKLFRLPRMKAVACTRPSVNQPHGLS